MLTLYKILFYRYMYMSPDNDLPEEVFASSSDQCSQLTSGGSSSQSSQLTSDVDPSDFDFFVRR